MNYNSNETLKLNVLVIGDGGREHAIIKSIIKSPMLNKLYTTSKTHSELESISFYEFNEINDFFNLTQFCKAEGITFVIIGGEKYLSYGISDHLKDEGINCFGPTKNAARLESSKSFVKDICSIYSIPTPCSDIFFNEKNAIEHINKINEYPVVIKLDGLASGKGVDICHSLDEATESVQKFFKLINDPVKNVNRIINIIIEEFIDGTEISFFSMIDGKNVLPLTVAHDYKKIIDKNGKEYNTGGMGAYSIPNIISDDCKHTILRNIIYPTINALTDLSIEFQGVLYAGLIIGKNKQIYLLEYNVRFGDPETQVILPRIKNDLLTLMIKTSQGKLKNNEVELNNLSVATLVLASENYPNTDSYQEELITIDEEYFNQNKDKIQLLHAGTKIKDYNIYACKGRCLNILVQDESIDNAIKLLYESATKISWRGMQYNKNIGSHLINL